MIQFNQPYQSGRELTYIQDAIDRNGLASESHYSRLAQSHLQEYTRALSVLLTPSCTHALEICALLLDLQIGDEVIMPSFTFVSAANAFALRGARIVFVDIEPTSMNIDAQLIEAAITDRTRAIVVMHYGGVACDMDPIMEIADEHDLIVIEDAAQAIGATYKGQMLGSIGDLGTYSFHYTKNIHCGEGGALLINRPQLMARAEILREKGTNRKKFMRGEIDRYSWVDIGSSYLLSELNAAFLYAQLEQVDEVNQNRISIWKNYQQELLPISNQIGLPPELSGRDHNAHTFFIKCKDQQERSELIQYLKELKIASSFHYVPLHSSVAGQRFGAFHGEDRYTTKEANRLLRLPLYYGLEESTAISRHIRQFYDQG